MAKPLYETLELDYTFPLVEQNPIPYMNKYIDPSLIQTAAQELELTNYRVASVIDDLGDEQLEFEFDIA